MKDLQDRRQVLEKNLHSPNFKGLATEYPSFDLLWFDIETRTRQIMGDMLDPIVDKLLAHRELITSVQTEGTKTDRKLEELKEMLFNTKNQIDVFDQINLRIAETNGKVKILDERVTYENKQLKSRMHEVDLKHDVAQQMFRNLQEHTAEVMQEVSKIKDAYRKQCDIFVGEVKRLDEQMIDNLQLVMTRCDRLDGVTNHHQMKLSIIDSNLQELY